MKKIAKIFLLTAMMCMLLCAVQVYATTAVTIVKLTIDDPEKGALPDETVELTKAASTKVLDVVWFDGNGDEFTDEFQEGKEYTVQITLGIRDDKDAVFSSTLSKINATVNGNKAVVVEGSKTQLTVEYTWGSTNAADTTQNKSKSISFITVTGVTPPAIGKSPNLGFATDYDDVWTGKSAQWTAPAWADYEKFVEGKEYTFEARVALSAYDEYSFDESIFEGQKATVNGNPATVKRGMNKTYVDICYTFPVLEDTTPKDTGNMFEVSIALNGPREFTPMEVPKVEKKAHNYVIESYTWSDTADSYGEYKHSTTYTLKLTLVPKSDNFSFSNNNFNCPGKNSSYAKIAGKKAKVVSYAPDKLVIEYKFQPTKSFKGVRPATLADSPYTFDGGSGTSEDPYLISTAQQLNAIRKGMDKHYKLTSDIDLSDWGNWIPIGSNEAYGGARSGGGNGAYYHIETFTGSLDGDGHVISGMTIKIDAEEIYMQEVANTRYYGLFMNVDPLETTVLLDGMRMETLDDVAYKLDKKTNIRNLGVINYNIDIHHKKIEQMYDVYAGAIAGTTHDSGIFNCYSAGGKIRIDLRDANAKHIIHMRVGSLVGDSSFTIFRNCYSLSDIEVLANSEYEGGMDLTAAGISGANTASWFVNCFNKGSVTMPMYTTWGNDGDVYSGAAAGITAACYAPIFPELYHNGERKNAFIYNCYNAGTLKGEFTGGIMIYGNSDFYIDNCYNVGKLLGEEFPNDITQLTRNYPIFNNLSCTEIVKFGTEYVRNTYTNGKSIKGSQWVYSASLDRMVLKTIPEDNLKTHTPVFNKPSGKTPFTDVVSGSFYEDAVKWALDNSVTSGTSATTFDPMATCTRGQVVTFLWRANGCQEPATSNNPFTDVKSSDYFYKAVLWAVEKGITTGTSETTFSPSNTCTSAQVVTFLYRAKGSPDSGADITATAKPYQGQYYFNAVNWADKNGLLSNVSATFAPNNNSPRADIVTYLYRCAK